MASYKALNTVRKSVIPNTCHTVWYVDAREGITVIKSTFSNTCHTIWYVDTREGITA